MKTKKLWLWSIVMGFIATAIFYIVISSDKTEAVNSTVTETQETSKSDEVETPPTASNQTNEIKETSNNNSNVAKEENKKEKDSDSNEILPISNGKRAMTIKAEDFQGVAGFIKPGSHVDVVAKLIAPEEAKKGDHNAATIILQNVKVLALGHAADDNETKKRYNLVTLEVSSKEGLALGLATEFELYLMLRADGDNKKDPFHTHIHEDELHKGVFSK